MGAWATNALGGGMSADARLPALPSDPASPGADIAYLYSLLATTQRYIFRSGISDLIAGVLWTLTLIGAVIGIPLVVFGIYKLTTHARRSEMSPVAFAASAKKIAIVQIATGFLSIAGLIWGFVILHRAASIRSICERHGIPG